MGNRLLIPELLLGVFLKINSPAHSENRGTVEHPNLILQQNYDRVNAHHGYPKVKKVSAEMITKAEEIASFESGDATRIVVSEICFTNGKETCLDVRKFVTTERYSGPTRQGIVLRWEDLIQLIPILIEREKSIEGGTAYTEDIAA